MRDGREREREGESLSGKRSHGTFFFSNDERFGGCVRFLDILSNLETIEVIRLYERPGKTLIATLHNLYIYMGVRCVHISMCKYTHIHAHTLYAIRT